MAANDPNAPVFDWPLPVGDPGREVWYGLAGPTDGSAALWYRYTLLSTERGSREARLWAAVTDRKGDSTFVSTSFPLEEASLRGDPFRFTVKEAELTSNSAFGEIEDVTWDLSYDPDSYAFTPLRSERITDILYRIADSGKHWSRNEAIQVDGQVSVGDQTLSFDGVPGHQGHTIGVSPPDRWAWIQCNGFPDESVALECLNLEGTLSMCLRRNGTVHELNRLRDVIGPWSSQTDHIEPGRWQFSAAGESVDLTATVEADHDHWQRVAYMTPNDTPRYNAHCSVSSVTITYTVDGGPERTLESNAGRAEWVDVEKPIPGEYRPQWE